MTVWGEKAYLCAYHHKDTPEVLATEIYQGKSQATTALVQRLARPIKLPPLLFEDSDTWSDRNRKISERLAERVRLAKEAAKDYVLVTFSLVRND